MKQAGNLPAFLCIGKQRLTREASDIELVFADCLTAAIY